MVRRVIFETAVILFFSVMLSLGASLLRPETLSWVARERLSEETSMKDAAYQLIDLEKAGRLHAQGTARFADARLASAYEKGHIAGAVNLYPFDFDQWSQRITDEIGPQEVIITYCDGPQCPLARQLAEKLTWLGFEQVFYLKDGWVRWQGAGFPID